MINIKTKTLISYSIIVSFAILSVIGSIQATDTSINQSSSNDVAGIRFVAANTPIDDDAIPNPDFAIYKGYVLDAYGNPISGSQISYIVTNIITGQEVYSGCMNIQSDGYFEITILKIYAISLTASAPGYYSDSIGLSVSNYIIFNLDRIPPPSRPPRLVP